MARYRVFLGVLLIVSLAAGASALLLGPVQAAPDRCLQRTLPPPLEQACRGCLDVWAPVLCTIRCTGNTTEEMLFSNQCYANCSGYVIVGDCIYVGP
jgi:hypothetical protein